MSVHGDSVYAPGGMFPERRRVIDGGHTWTSYKAGSGDSAVLVQGTGVWMIDHSYRTTINTVGLGTGRSGWSYELPEARHHSIAVDGNRAFVRNDGSLYALPVF
ncbi:PQQ-binding-like beta-propeller repeat protein [Streptomyces sp. CA-142005]|uniref:PQQ-binding-like beta-propeller repeat protein n=1 Tax=Streptomyces sp. CA-142005 TaxID=3240052 RepID=UPI003D8F7228